MSRKIGQYEIKRELGQGGMGIVYLGYDPRLDREVAIKVLKPSLYIDDPGFSARFEREAKTVASLTHSCIVPIYEYGDDGEWRYFVMPFMSGGTLRDRLENGPLTLEEVLPILRRVAAALDKAHSNGIIHRDLKPGNILFDDDGEAYLSDFGIMKLADPMGKGTVQLTSIGVSLGTPHYISPEQLDGAEDLDGRTDIYALGIILYEMLTSKKPYDHESVPRIIAMHYSHPIPNILEANPSLPSGIADVIHMSMAKRREERYKAAKELLTVVKEVITGQTSRDTTPQSKTKPKSRLLGKSKPAREKKPVVLNRNNAKIKALKDSISFSRAKQARRNAEFEKPNASESEKLKPRITKWLAKWRGDFRKYPKFLKASLLFSGLPMVIVFLFLLSESMVSSGGISHKYLYLTVYKSVSLRDEFFALSPNIYHARLNILLLLIPISIILAVLIGFLHWSLLRNYFSRAWPWVPLYILINLIASLGNYFIYAEQFVLWRPIYSSELFIFIRVNVILFMGLLPILVGFIFAHKTPKKFDIR